jgi:hypothetical protein
VQVADTKIRRNTRSEWEKLEKSESEFFPKVKIISVIPKTNSDILDEYDKLYSTLVLEHVNFMDTFYKTQKSYTEIILDYVNMYSNFIHLCFDWNSRISSFYMK